MIVTLLAIALAIALFVMTVAVLALLADGRRINRLERRLEIAGQANAQLIAERSEARRSLREAMTATRARWAHSAPDSALPDELTRVYLRPDPGLDGRSS